MHYRLQQLVRALLGRIDANDRALVARLLSPNEQRLFAQMARFDQRHVLDVCRILIGVGQCDPTLLRAALLHDCGKIDDMGRPIPLVYYGLFVVLQRLAPALYAHAAASGRGLLRPFQVHATHESRSLWLARAAGCPAASLAILAGYQHAAYDSLGFWLRWADNQC